MNTLVNAVVKSLVKTHVDTLVSGFVNADVNILVHSLMNAQVIAGVHPLYEYSHECSSDSPPLTETSLSHEVWSYRYIYMAGSINPVSRVQPSHGGSFFLLKRVV